MPVQSSRSVDVVPSTIASGRVAATVDGATLVTARARRRAATPP